MNKQRSDRADSCSERPLCESASSLEHWLTSAVGLGMALAIGVAFYVPIVETAASLEFLSTTAMVFLITALWLVLWGTLELAWEWRAGRVHR
ncbi:hypothetical protein ACOZ4I_06220 [Haloarcula salina]|uniref:hypothetical protein n=1 Tax=Haloarcula salina TaxID=1429914 RepID=UPI003C6F1CA0